MTPTPVALGLSLCDYILIEENSRKASLIGCFTALAVPAVPSSPCPFFVFAEMTDAAGAGIAEVAVTRLDTGVAVYRQARRITFADRFAVVRYGMRVTGCEFPIAGKYSVSLFVDGELVAQRELEVRSQRS